MSPDPNVFCTEKHENCPRLKIKVKINQLAFYFQIFTVKLRLRGFHFTSNKRMLTRLPLEQVHAHYTGTRLMKTTLYEHKQIWSKHSFVWCKHAII